MPPVFALVDCNNFYVSCERVFQPKLEGASAADLVKSMQGKSEPVARKGQVA
jgi:hypothetical protein